MPSSARGKSKNLKMEDIFKILIPQCAGLETGIITLRSIYAQMHATIMVAIARDHHSTTRSTDAAEMDFMGFKGSIESILKFKRDQMIRDEISNTTLKQANSYIESEIARRLQQESESTSSKSEAPRAMDLS